jgi:hypothetical protein
MHKVLPLALAVKLIAFPGDPTAEAIKEFGLVGRWAEDCDHDPTREGFEVPQSGDTSFYVVKVKENEIIYRRKIVHAEIVSPDTLIWQYTDSVNTYSITFKKTPAGGIRAFAMVDQLGRKTVENGYSVGQAPREQPVETKCQ